MSLAMSPLPPVRRPPTLIGVGGVAWTGDPSIVYSTLLGSCIAVCLFDPCAEKGGMNHFLLAHAPAGHEDDSRYGTVSLRNLLRSLLTVGCAKERLRAVLAGGADLLSNMRAIGTENSTFALEWLRSENIRIVDKNYGGDMARRVRFVPTTGECAITQVNANPPDPVSQLKTK